MPTTPKVPRPVGRTCSSLKRIDWPSAVERISLLLAVGQTHADHLVPFFEADGANPADARGLA